MLPVVVHPRVCDAPRGALLAPTPVGWRMCSVSWGCHTMQGGKHGLGFKVRVRFKRRAKGIK